MRQIDLPMNLLSKQATSTIPPLEEDGETILSIPRVYTRSSRRGLSAAVREVGTTVQLLDRSFVVDSSDSSVAAASSECSSYVKLK